MTIVKNTLTKKIKCFLFPFSSLFHTECPQGPQQARRHRMHSKREKMEVLSLSSPRLSRNFTQKKKEQLFLCFFLSLFLILIHSPHFFPFFFRSSLATLRSLAATSSATASTPRSPTTPSSSPRVRKGREGGDRKKNWIFLYFLLFLSLFLLNLFFLSLSSSFL